MVSEKHIFQVYDPTSGGHTTKNMTAKEYLLEHHELQNDTTRQVSVNGETATKNITKTQIADHINTMPDDKALELARTLHNNSKKDQGIALHTFFSDALGNKQENNPVKTAESAPEKGGFSLLALFGIGNAEASQGRVAAEKPATDNKAVVKLHFADEFKKIADGKEEIKYQVNLSDNRGNKVIDNMTVPSIKTHTDKYIENLPEGKALELATKMQGTKFERAAATTEIISAAYEAHEKAKKTGVAQEETIALKNTDAENGTPSKLSKNDLISAGDPKIDKAHGNYLIENGDTMYGIARKHLEESGQKPNSQQVRDFAKAIAELNRTKVKDIDRIYAGDTITVDHNAIKAQLANMAQQGAKTTEIK